MDEAYNRLEMINFETNKMIPLTNKDIESCPSQENCVTYKESLMTNTLMMIQNCRVKDHCNDTGKYTCHSRNLYIACVV